MIRLIRPLDLASAPADVQYDVPQKIAGDLVYFEVANLSPYVMEIQDETGVVRGLAGAFQYTAIPLNPITNRVTLHVIATETSSPIPAASYAVYGGITRNPPVPSAKTA